MSLEHQLPDEVVRQLKELDLDASVPEQLQPERVSFKDQPYVELLQQNPDLRRAIVASMSLLSERRAPVPIIHITSSAVQLPDGSAQTTGYLESITSEGLRARDTNVGCLVEQGESTHVASSEYFAMHPHKFVRALATTLQHYIHHGSRSNKASLGDARDAGQAIPAMVMIDATDVSLLRGTDYDDHFTLGGSVAPERIIGLVDVAGRRPGDLGDMAIVAQDFLERVDEYLDDNHRGSIHESSL